MKIKYSIAFCLSILTHSFWAQFDFDFNDSIPVKIGTNDLSLAWAGGLNYVQISDIDIDFDGDLDLFLFDRSKDNIRVLEQYDDGTKKYRSLKNAQNHFPSDLKNRVALLDYNLDGKNDIFAYGIGGVKVYKNTGNAFTGLTWELVTDLIYSDYDGDFSNLYVSSADIPAYIDVDFDNDIDILTFNVAGDHLEYHQNQSQELFGHSDSLIFILKNRCWGKFTEDAITGDITLNAQDGSCTSGNVPNPQLRPNDYVLKSETELTRHAGSTILGIDYDNSGVYDLVIGDVSFNNLYLLMNDGTAPNTHSAMISLDANFPSNTTPSNVSIFPAAFFVDVDFDQIKDLVVCPNAKTISENENSIQFYKNLGSNALPNFSFRTKSYFQEEMIEVGTGSIPVFVDQNGDDKQDLIIGNYYRYKDLLDKESVNYNFRNTGTTTAPIFTFVESDYLNLSLESYGLRTVPAFSDIDSDGDQDLFYGLENGTLIFRENTAGANNPMLFDTPQSNYTDNLGNVISVQNYAFPQLFDLNEDNLLDLIIGKKTGELVYYQNIGSASNPLFELKNDTLGGIDLATLTPDGFAAPHFFSYQDTIRLLLGSYDGKLHFYDDVEGNLNAGSSFHLISDNYKGIDVEGFSSCFVNDIDNDGNLDLFVGGDLGGIFHLEHSDNSTLSINAIKKESTFFEVFPNPATNEIVIKTKNEFEKVSLEIRTSLGGLISKTELLPNQKLDVSFLKSGSYLLVLKSKNGEFQECKKLIIVK